MAERDRKPDAERADYLSDFPEEFEQRPDGPPRDQARRARASKASAEALARIEAMKKKVEALLTPREDSDASES